MFTDLNDPANQPVRLSLPGLTLAGVSIAGQRTMVYAPDHDVCFDIGLCPAAVLNCPTVAISHGHLDHTNALLYYLWQRHMQHMTPGCVVCPHEIGPAIRRMMDACLELEDRPLPYVLTPLKPDQSTPLNETLTLRAFATRHTVASLGYLVVNTADQKPLLAYTGDTSWGPHFQRPDVRDAQVLVTECTFFESAHRRAALASGHLHLTDIVSLLDLVNARTVVLTHLSRRLPIERARRMLNRVIPARHRDRVRLLSHPTPGEAET